MKNPFAPQKSILGINKRNLSYVYRYNQRKLFPLANDKLLTKRCLHEAGIPHPETYAVIDAVFQLKGLGKVLHRLDDFVIKPAKGKGGGGGIRAEEQVHGVPQELHVERHP